MIQQQLKWKLLYLFIPCLTLITLYYDKLFTDVLSIEGGYLLLTTCLIGISLLSIVHQIPVKLNFTVLLGIIIVTIYNYRPLFAYSWGYGFSGGSVPLVLELATFVNVALMLQSMIQVVRLLRLQK